MREYVLGIDGGGTKTDCVLCSIKGEFIDAIKWGTTSHEFLEDGFNAVQRELGRLFQTVFEKHSISPKQIKKAVLGMAGVDTRYQQQQLEGIAGAIGLTDFIVCNDGYLGVKAGTTNGVGLNVINGTGCSFQGINAEGEMLQIGGQAVLMDDVAGGYIIGRNLIRLAHKALFLEGEPTLLSNLLLQQVGDVSRWELMDELMRKVSEKEIEIKHLSPLMFEAAAQGDTVAKAYLADMGKQMAHYCIALIKGLQMQKQACIEIVLIGSAFLRAVDETHVHTMEEVLQKRYPSIVLKPLRISPVCGAVQWAFENCGLKTDRQEVFSQIMSHV